MTNPMKPAPASDVVKELKFTSDSVKSDAEAAAEVYGFELSELIGTAKDGAISKGDLKKVVETAESAKQLIKTATDAGIDVDALEGTGDGGEVTLGDLQAAVDALDDGGDDSDDEEGTEEDEAAVAQFEQNEDEFIAILDELISFGAPVKGALNTKPKVQQRWIELFQRAVKARNSL